MGTSYIFITVACGAVSGFHATQSPMIAKCIKTEREGRTVFYGAMIFESVIALVWAAAGVAFYGSTQLLSEALKGGASNVVYEISTGVLGVAGGILFNVSIGVVGNIKFTASWATVDGVSMGALIDRADPEAQAGNAFEVKGDFGHYNLDAAGSGNQLFAAWTTVTAPVDENADELAALTAGLASGEITVARYNGSKWEAQQLTDNACADVLPKIASKDGQAVVVWIQGASSAPASNEFSYENIMQAAAFDVDSKLMYSFYNGSAWSEPAALLNTATLGSVDSLNLVLLDDGTAVAAFALQTNPEGKAEGTEICYAIIDPSTGACSAVRATDNNVPDGTQQIVTPGFYIKGVYGGQNTALSDLACAIYRYCEAARAYFD